MNLRSLALFGGLAVLASCDPPKSKNPLTDPNTALVDSRLAGVWTGRVGTEGTEATLSIFPRERAVFDVVLVGHDEKQGAVVLTFEGFPSAIDGKKYWNLRAKSFEGEYAERPKLSDTYIFVRYEIAKDGSLALWEMDDSAAGVAVKAGTLLGFSSKDSPLMLTDSSEKLAAFVATLAGQKGFGFFATFQRAKLQYPKGGSK